MRNNKTRRLTYERKKSLVGYGFIALWLIGFFMVDAARQGTGLGSRLVSETAACLRAAGLSRLRLGVDRGNPQSFAFWTKNGFEQVDEGHYIVMERDIQTARRGI